MLDALGAHEPALAEAMLDKSVTLTRRLPDEARNWAVAWNVAGWNRLHTTQARAVVTDALAQIRTEKDYGPWKGKLPELVTRVASIDVPAAHTITRNVDKKLRLPALLALASVMDERN